MASSSYDELLRQVENLRSENSQLRQEIHVNSSNVTQLENEVTEMKNPTAATKMDDEDASFDEFDEEGIHVFAQGGGGESRDTNPNEEDVSPNDNLTFSAFKQQQSKMAEKNEQQKSNEEPRQNETKQTVKGMSTNDILMLALQELHNERGSLLRDLDDEDRHRKWYFEQLENIRRKVDALPSDLHNRQLDLTRRQYQLEAKKVRDTFEETLGTNEQIIQRQEARLQRVRIIEEEIMRLHSQQQRSRQQQMQVSNMSESTDKDQTEDIYNQEPEQDQEEVDNISIAIQTADLTTDEAADATIIDPDASFNVSSLYHGAWPISPLKKDSRENSIQGVSQQQQQQDVASIMSFNSTNTNNSQNSKLPTKPHPPSIGEPPEEVNGATGQPQPFGTKVEMVYSLLSMLGTHDKDDMSRTLLAMSSSQDSCIAMRQSGCMPLLIQLLHGSDKDSALLGNTRGSKEARARAAAALHNIVHSHPDDKRGRREARVLRLLEQLRAHCDQLRDSLDEEEDGKVKTAPRTGDMEHHPGPAVAALMKLSFDEEHRHAICCLGGVQAIADLIEVDQLTHGHTTEQYNITLRRYGCMALTNLTFGDGTNKALLCSMHGFMEGLVEQLKSSCEDLVQVAASVLRNLSWKADLASKKSLRHVGAATTLMRASMVVKKEATLKSILSALWNLSAHGSENKAEICAVEGALEFLVKTLTYKSPSKTTAVIENGGGVLRNISSHITVREDYRLILRQQNCLPLLLRQLRSASLTIVSNACGTLWNLSARCVEDQKALWDMGAVSMLKNLVNSKHQMIAMGSSAALKNLVAAFPSIKSMNMDLKQNMNRPMLHVRKQRALEESIDQNLSETCDNVESPRDSPTDTSQGDKDRSHFRFPVNQNVVNQIDEVDGGLPRGPVYQHSNSGENSPRSDSRLLSPKRVARSGSQDSVGSTHSDISHDRLRYHGIKQLQDRHGGSLDRNTGQRQNVLPENSQLKNANSRIAQTMKEVEAQRLMDNNMNQQAIVNPQASRADGQFSLPHALLYRSFNMPSSSNQQVVMGNYGNNPIYGMPQTVNMIYNAQSSSDEDNDQPIDYSMKYTDVQNTPSPTIRPQLPPAPRYAFVRPSSDQHVNMGPRMMHHSFSGQPSFNRFGFQQQIRMMSPSFPPPQVMMKMSSSYTETDLDHDDQPTDFSVRYAENHDEPYNEKQRGYEPERSRPYEPREQDPYKNCADCKLEEARWMNDRIEEMHGNEDQVTTFYTEGTPRYYLSMANSLTDLSKPVHDHDNNDTDDGQMKEEPTDYSSQVDEKQSGSGSEKRSGSGSLNTDHNTGSTVIPSYSRNSADKEMSPDSSRDEENVIQQSFHAPDDDDTAEDQIKTYCEEGTPICFSRVSSLSSLHSSEAHDRGDKTPTTGVSNLQSINEHDDTPQKKPMCAPKYTPITGRQKLLSDSDNTECSEKERKTVTFDDSHHVEDTPLMFSRCSSPESLSSFDGHSVHSSVVSEYSRRASEVVSPSELPDSPSESMPGSPNPEQEQEKGSDTGSKQSDFPSLPKQFTNLLGRNVQMVRPLPPGPQNPIKRIPMDTASTVSKDEPPRIYADEGTPPYFSETCSVLSSLTVDDPEPVKPLDLKNNTYTLTNIDENDETVVYDHEKDDSSNSEVSEGEEDILKQCISAAMPRKMRRSSSDNMIKKKNGSKSESPNKSDKQKQKTAMRMSHSEDFTNNGAADDDVKLFANEGLPPQANVKKVPPQPQPKPKNQNNYQLGSENQDSLKKYADENVPYSKNLASAKQQNRQAQGGRVLQAQQTNSQVFYKVGPSAQHPQGDTLRHYANEGAPPIQNANKPKNFQKIQNILRGDVDIYDSYGDSVTSYATEGTPMNGSAAVSPSVKKANPFNFEDVDEVEIPDDDMVKSYAVEDTPYNISMPTSPKHEQSTDKAKLEEKHKEKLKQLADLDKHEGEDAVTTYATEDTPISFSHATSLSDLSVITTNLSVGDESLSPKPEIKLKNETENVNEKDEIEQENADKTLKGEDDDTESEGSSFDDDSDDLLSEIIMSAMPKGKDLGDKNAQVKNSQKYDTDRKAEGSETKSSTKSCQLNEKQVKSQPESHPKAFQPQRTSSHISTSVLNMNTDQIRTYTTEDTPNNFSSATSLSDLTIDSSDIPINFSHPVTTGSTTFKESISISRTFQNSVDDSVFIHSESADSVRIYNVEDTPQSFSCSDSLSSLGIIDDDKDSTSEKLAKLLGSSKTSKSSGSSILPDPDLQREVEGQSSDETKSTKSESVKSLETEEIKNTNFVDDDDDDDAEFSELDEALLNDCITSALPKSRPKSEMDKSQNSSRRSVPNSSSLKDISSNTRKDRHSIDSGLPFSEYHGTIETQAEVHSRMSRSCSSAEDFEYMNHGRSRHQTHESRYSSWQKTAQDKPSEFIFAKPADVKRGAWKRSRSQDNEGIKERKEFSNMELAKSGQYRGHTMHYSVEAIPTYQDNNQSIHGYHSLPRRKNVRSNEQLYDKRMNRSLEKFNQQYDNITDYGPIDHPKQASYEEVNEIAREIASHPIIGLDNFGFDSGGSNENVALDSADVTMTENVCSANVTITNEDIQNAMQFVMPEDGGEDPECSFEEEFTTENERSLLDDASRIVMEIQHKRMIGSSMDEDMFIDNETMSLVSCGYTSDTASEKSGTWSVHSEKISDFSGSTPTEDFSISSGPRIVKPNEKPMAPQKSVESDKSVRGRRKPLYSPRTPHQQKPTPTKQEMNAINAKQANITKAIARPSGPARSRSHPQASSTPNKAQMKPKIPKPNGTTPVSRLSVNAKNSPSRLPTATTPNRKVIANSAEKPKPLVKQGTFTKESSFENAPIIGSHEDNRKLENVDNVDNGQPVSSGKKQNKENAVPNSWVKALNSHNFILDSTEDKTENLETNKTVVKTLKTIKSSGPSQTTKTPVKNTKNKVVNSDLKKTLSGTQLNVTKTGSGNSLNKVGTNLNKSGSGQMLNKSGSGQMLNKSGSSVNLNKSGSGNYLNRSGQNLKQTGSNPNLKKVSSKSDLKKSDSIASLKNNSRPTTPVARKNSATNPPSNKKSESQLNKSSSFSSENRRGSAGVGKKQVGSKIAGLWKKDDSFNEGTPKSNNSKLPVSTVSPSRLPRANSGSKLQPPKTDTLSAKNISIDEASENQKDEISRSSTYDKLVTVNRCSQLPCPDNESDEEVDNEVMKLSGLSLQDKDDDGLKSRSKGNNSENRKSVGGKSSQSSISPEKESTSYSKTSSSSSKDISPEKNKSVGDFDLKSLEKRIDSGTWKKKKSDLDKSSVQVPDADETSKSLEAVKLLLESSIANGSIAGSVMNESVSSQASSTMSSWRRNTEESFASVASDDEDSIWVRRDGNTSRSEPELNKHSLSPKKKSKEKKEGSKSFLPKGLKNIFSRKSSESKKSGSKSSLYSSRESIHSIHSVHSVHSVSVCEVREIEKMNKKKGKKEKDSKKRNSSVCSLDNVKTSPQSALVPPFNYKPSATVVKSDTESKVDLNKSRIDDDDVFLKPAVPAKKAAAPPSTQHATKTEMLMARRRASFLNSVKSDGSSGDEKKSKSCKVTTV
ncbi:adenomatous polyposis coli protein-like isoform X1 [Mytilus californianus]|uniref:adenomatous polyposis coli protein-like isoform X1 n=1 Tax=Mytilus californianus TaxID=6549 RepID=UPI0022484686|nr:adenomatous polyposis coli protein-like isoform X1 [Mytilus californianus]